MFKKFATAAAATSLLLAGSAQAATAVGSAQALSLRNAPQVRSATVTTSKSRQAEGLSPLFIIGGIVGVVAILELTGAINIFGSDDSDSN